MKSTIIEQCKPLLTLKEASQYTGIGINRLRQLTNEDGCEYVLFIGNKRMIKMDRFLNFLNDTYSI